MIEYRLEPGARDDLLLISDYIAKDNVTAAEKLIDRFHQTFRFLAANPLAGELRSDLATDLRQFTLGNYVILFKSFPAGVTITQIVHGARDLSAVFRRDRPSD